MVDGVKESEGTKDGLGIGEGERLENIDGI